MAGSRAVLVSAASRVLGGRGQWFCRVSPAWDPSDVFLMTRGGRRVWGAGRRRAPAVYHTLPRAHAVTAVSLWWLSPSPGRVMAANTPLPTLCSSEGSRRTGLPRQARRAPFPGQSPRFRYWEFYGNQLSPSSTYLVTHSTIHLRQHGLPGSRFTPDVPARDFSKVLVERKIRPASPPNPAD